MRARLKELNKAHDKEWWRAYRAKNYIHTTVNGKRVFLRTPNKRSSPGYCELCGTKDVRLGYHHWDDSNPSKGLWLCYKHHMFAELVDRGLVDDYLRLRESVEEEFRQKGLEPTRPRPSLVDIVASWSLQKEV